MIDNLKKGGSLKAEGFGDGRVNSHPQATLEAATQLEGVKGKRIR